MRRLVLLGFLILLIPYSAFAVGGIDGRGTNAGGCNGPVATCNTIATPATGETIIIGASWIGSVTAAATDSAGNTYNTLVGPVAATRGNLHAQAWVLNKPSKAGTYTFIVNLNGNESGNFLIWVWSLTGTVVSNPIDASASNSGAGSVPTMRVASGVPGGTNDMFWGLFFIDRGGTPPSVGTDWTTAGTENYSMAEYKNVNAAVAQTATGTNNNGSNWIGIVFAIKASSG